MPRRLLVSARIVIVSCDDRRPQTAAWRRWPGGTSRGGRWSAARPPARRARAQSRGPRHRVLPPPRASLRAHIGHADLALSRPGARSRRRVARPRAVVGGVPPGARRPSGHHTAAEPADDALLNAGLAYLLVLAWRAFLDSEHVVAGVDVHPAVETLARRLH